MNKTVKNYFDANLLEKIKNINVKKTQSDILGALGLGEMISTQSFLISSGYIYEHFWNNVISNSPNVINLIQDKNTIELMEGLTGKRKKRKKKQTDVVFKSLEHDIIYYRECKCNLNFDSEKSPASIEKINVVGKLLAQKYNTPITNINVGYFNPVQVSISQRIKNKAPEITNQDGVEDFIKILGSKNVPFTCDEYFEYHRNVLAQVVAEKLQLNI